MADIVGCGQSHFLLYPQPYLAVIDFITILPRLLTIATPPLTKILDRLIDSRRYQPIWRRRITWRALAATRLRIPFGYYNKT